MHPSKEDALKLARLKGDLMGSATPFHGCLGKAKFAVTANWRVNLPTHAAGSGRPSHRSKNYVTTARTKLATLTTGNIGNRRHNFSQENQLVCKKSKHFGGKFPQSASFGNLPQAW
jgi:hypothetical protein